MLGQAPGRETLRLGVDAVDFEALRFIEKEGFVDAASEPAIKFVVVVCPNDEQVFCRRHAVGTVVDHRLVAVEGEPIVHVPLDGRGGAAGNLVGGDELYVGSLLLDLAGKGTSGIVHIKLFTVKAEEKDEHRKNRQQSDIAHLRDAPVTDGQEDDCPEDEGSGTCNE